MKKLGNKNNNISINIGGSVNNSQVIGAGRDVNIGNQQSAFVDNELTLAFDQIYTNIEKKYSESNAPSSEVVSTVKLIEQETKNGEQANESKMRQWLKFLADMSPDIFDVVSATLCSPISGISEIIRKLSLRMRRDYGYKTSKA